MALHRILTTALRLSLSSHDSAFAKRVVEI